MLDATLTHLANRAATPQATYPEALHDIASLEKAQTAFAAISRWPASRHWGRAWLTRSA